MPDPGVVLREAASSRDQQPLHYRSDMGVEVLFVPWQLPCYLKVPRGRATPIGTPAFVWPNLSPKLKEVSTLPESSIWRWRLFDATLAPSW